MGGRTAGCSVWQSAIEIIFETRTADVNRRRNQKGGDQRRGPIDDVGISRNPIPLRLIRCESGVNFVFDQHPGFERLPTPLLQNEIGGAVSVSMPYLLADRGALEIELCICR
ncbi:hypothetical protein [Bradyrhizobium sp. B120]|uniref:hypothetical protein n=1 Tax=Bradyrhizobium sp. B120 TaxID=3410088 RepID=UPI003B97EC6E